MLEAGIKGTQEVKVTEENTALTMGSGTLKVFNTFHDRVDGKDGMAERCTASGRGQRHRRHTAQRKSPVSDAFGHDSQMRKRADRSRWQEAGVQGSSV